jgi:hypothetical protein
VVGCQEKPSSLPRALVGSTENVRSSGEIFLDRVCASYDKNINIRQSGMLNESRTYTDSGSEH